MKFKSKLVVKNLRAIEWIDSDTGELLERYNQKEIYVSCARQEFFYVYKHILSAIGKVKASDVKVFISIGFRVNFGDNTIHIGKEQILGIAKECSMEEGSVRNSICSLHKNGILLKMKGRGDYRMNPDVAWQGDHSNRPMALKFHMIEEFDKNPDNRRELAADYKNQDIKKNDKVQ